jgi:hypothetical protein
MMISLYMLFSIIACNSYTDNLQLELLDQQLKIGLTKPKRGQPCINTCSELSFRLSNPTEKDYILYDFDKLPYLATERDSLYHNNFIFIAGVHVFVYDLENKQIEATRYISDDIDYKPMTPDFIMLKLKESRKKFRNSRVIIRKGESFEFNHNIDFRDFELKPGVYYVKLIYFQGPNVTHQLDSSLIKEDEESYNAKVYTGRFWSNKIKLVVE